MTQTFAILPAGTRTLWVLVPLFVLLLGGLGAGAAVLGGAWYGSQRATFEVSPAGLRLRGDVYGRLIPASELRGTAARIIDLRSDAEHRPRRRTFGTGLPGYAAGWFRLHNGEKALLFLTDWTHVVYVPTRDGYAVLLSPGAPEAMLRAIQQIASAS
jgi:hypothetical protein